ncbi:hypothetical protein ACHAWF_009706, partial [Thalassiosira exigua]
SAGLGVFAGKSYPAGSLVGRVGNPAFPTVDHDWHNSPPASHVSKNEGDYHWPLTNYDWHARDVGMDDEAEDVTVTVAGFGAAPNCHFRLLNVEEHRATYATAGIDRYDSPGAGASTPWFNRSSTAERDVAAGSELFVDYGSNWFLSRENFNLVPVYENFEKAQAFLKKYGRLLVGSENPKDLVEDKMSLDDEVQKDLWEVVKTFPYPTREREALPESHKDAVRAIHGDIQAIEKENSIRSVDYLKEHGKCVDNIVPGPSNIPHAGRGAFATRFIPKGGLVAPAPVVHIVDKVATNMYAETIGGPQGNIVRDEEKLVSRQIILNYVFGHPNSTVVLFPYSSNVAYINHDAAEYNAELRWAKDAPWIHREDWLNKSVEFLEDQWSSGLMLEFIALRDIQQGEEVLINYGEEWQKAWDEHVKNWKPMPPESDFNNVTWWTQPAESPNNKRGYIRAATFNSDNTTPLRTLTEQKIVPYSHNVQMICMLNTNHESAYLFQPSTVPFFVRDYDAERDDPDDFHSKGDYQHLCNITDRYVWENDLEDPEEEEENNHGHRYTVRMIVKKLSEEVDVFEEIHEIHNVPRSSIEFRNKYYSSDTWLKGAFRHEMKLPDELFPKAWMNVVPKKEEAEKEG